MLWFGLVRLAMLAVTAGGDGGWELDGLRYRPPFESGWWSAKVVSVTSPLSAFYGNNADAASGNTITGAEQVLVEDWCQQFPSHSIGTLLFGRDGALYAGGGEGASFNNVDYGQYGATYAGDQANPCGDPPSPAGTALAPPTAEGGALRSQSVRRTDGPATLDGAIMRIDPDTGQGLPDNPFCVLLRPQRPPHRGLRAAQPVPVHPASGHRRAMDRRCRLEHLGGDRPADRPDRQRDAQLRLAVL